MEVTIIRKVELSMDEQKDVYKRQMDTFLNQRRNVYFSLVKETSSVHL